MATTILSIGTSRKVHDINITSTNGRRFIVDIYEDSNGGYESEVAVLDNISSTKGSWIYKVSPSGSSVVDNFKASIEMIQKYCSSVDSKDSISDIHNSCNCPFNCPFISESQQNNVLSGLGVGIKVRVN